MTDFLSLIGAVPSLMASFSGSTVDPYKKQKKAITAALGDTTNPLYKQLYGQYKQQNLQGLSEGISEAEKRNRMANRLGRTPLFAEGRGGETLFRQMMRGYETAGTAAEQQTKQNLQQQLSNYGVMTQPTAQSNAQRLLGYQNIANLLSGKTMQQPQQKQKSLLEMLIGGY